MAYVVVFTLNVSMSCAPKSAAKPFLPSAAEPAAERVPSSLMRTSWTPAPSRAATMAYMVPSLASNAEAPYAPASLSKPSSPLIAEPAATRVPLAMRNSWTPLSVAAATRAYAEPLPALNMSTPLAPARTRPPSLSVPESAGERVPFGLTRIKCTPPRPWSLPPVAMAYVLLPISSASTLMMAPISAKPSALGIIVPLGTRVPLASMRMPCTPLFHDAASACMLSPSLNAVMASAPCSLNSLEESLFGPVAELIGSRVPFAWMRISWTPLSFFEATRAYVSFPIENAETSCAPPSTLKPSLPLVALPTGTSAGRSAVLIQMLLVESEP